MEKIIIANQIREGDLYRLAKRNGVRIIEAHRKNITMYLVGKLGKSEQQRGIIDSLAYKFVDLYSEINHERMYAVMSHIGIYGEYIVTIKRYIKPNNKKL